MKVIRAFGNKLDRPATDPLLEKSGVWWEIRAGDILDPIADPDGWFNPLPPKRVLRFYLPLWLSVVINLAWLALTAAALWCFPLWAPLILALHILIPIPGRWLSWKIGKKGGYFGTKIYGVDRPEYIPWAGAENVFDGSIAMHFSIRPFATIKD